MPITQGFAPGSAKNLQDAGGLFAPVNKSYAEGEDSLASPQDELALNKTDEELIALKRTWKADHAAYIGDIERRAEKNFDYWVGKQKGYNQSLYQTVDNVIFEDLETFLPLATQKSPDPLVVSDNTDDGIEIAMTVQKMLKFVSDKEKLKTKLKTVLRHWALSFVGVVKMGYDFTENEISVSVLDPKNLIFDPTGLNRYIGEKKRMKASKLIERFPKKTEEITLRVGGKLGTDIEYEEFWTNEIVFWCLDDTILLKTKNPHWNYDGVEMVEDETGEEIEDAVKGTNHFNEPKMPFVFLNVFSLGRKPHDETSVVEQSIPLMDGINKRIRQMDKNADDMNNGWLVSSQFSKDQAKSVADAIRRGGTVQAPTPNIDQSIKRVQAAPLPSFLMEDLLDKRNEIANIMGVRGSTAQGLRNITTVRGMQTVQQQDTNRITFTTEFVEQFVDDIFNWMVQLMHVYYTEKHVAAIVGETKAVDYISLSSADLDRKLTVTVQEGSMIPEDPINRRQTAIDLWNSKAIDPISLYERLGDATPQQSAEKLYKWLTNPGELFGQPALQPGLQPEPQMQPAPEVAEPQMMPPMNGNI